jgi:hypothetical protein
MQNKTIELARKIKALADSSEGGEQLSAIEHLTRFMKKHNLTTEDIESETLHNFYFYLEQAERRLFFQIAASEIADFGIEVIKGGVCMKLENATGVLFRAKYDFYKKKYKEQEAVFYTAFISKNDLWKKGETIATSSMDKEERKKRAAAEKMAKTIPKSIFLKQLS